MGLCASVDIANSGAACGRQLKDGSCLSNGRYQGKLTLAADSLEHAKVKKIPSKPAERVEKRLQVALPIRITHWDKDKKPILEMGCTYDISPHGARITSIKDIRQTGEIVALERGQNKSFCRVVWVGDPNSELKGQIGLAAIETDHPMWETELKAMQDVYDPLTWEEPQAAKPKARPESRRRHRFAVKGVAEIVKPGATASTQKAMVQDLSEMGCLLQTKETLPPGTEIKLVLKVGNNDMTLKGQVRNAVDVGVGVEFSAIRKADRQTLKHLLQKLAEEQLEESVELKS